MLASQICRSKFEMDVGWGWGVGGGCRRIVYLTSTIRGLRITPSILTYKLIMFQLQHLVKFLENRRIVVTD